MYGASWCPHCQKQKAAFGVDAFKYVNYVECPDNPKVCLDKKIKGYPTWIFPNGHRFEGEQSFEKLSKESSCPLPKD
jgi:thiol-disulfide isomerase/thioredoxin